MTGAADSLDVRFPAIAVDARTQHQITLLCEEYERLKPIAEWTLEVNARETEPTFGELLEAGMYTSFLNTMLRAMGVQRGDSRPPAQIVARGDAIVEPFRLWTAPGVCVTSSN